jgi:amino acid transporter
MPGVRADAGTSSLAVLAVIAVGAMALAALFGQLTKRVPNSDGGLYAYARREFGDFAGYLTGRCYWIQAWAGNAAIVSSWVVLCRCPIRHQAPGPGILGVRPDRAVDPGGGELGRDQTDGLAAEPHRGAEVPAAIWHGDT